MFRACFKKYDGRVWSNQKETIDYILVAIQVAIWSEDFPYLFIYLLTYLGRFALAGSGQFQHFFCL